MVSFVFRVKYLCTDDSDDKDFDYGYPAAGCHGTDDSRGKEEGQRQRTTEETTDAADVAGQQPGTGNPVSVYSYVRCGWMLNCLVCSVAIVAFLPCWSVCSLVGLIVLEWILGSMGLSIDLSICLSVCLSILF